MATFYVFTDGGARGNPGPGAIGVVIFADRAKFKLIFSYSGIVGTTTNNVAEYKAVVKAYQWLVENIRSYPQIANISIASDSQLVVNQLNGVFRVKDPQLIDYFFTVKKYEGLVGVPVTYSYIEREKNKLADFLVNKALDKSNQR